jgi:hypothetical protein
LKTADRRKTGLAGEEGIEPTYTGIKIRCLTTWRLPYTFLAAYWLAVWRIKTSQEALNCSTVCEAVKWMSCERAYCPCPPSSLRERGLQLHGLISAVSKRKHTRARTRHFRCCTQTYKGLLQAIDFGRKRCRDRLQIVAAKIRRENGRLQRSRVAREIWMRKHGVCCHRNSGAGDHRMRRW